MKKRILGLAFLSLIMSMSFISCVSNAKFLASEANGAKLQKNMRSGALKRTSIEGEKLWNVSKLTTEYEKIKIKITTASANPAILI